MVSAKLQKMQQISKRIIPQSYLVVRLPKTKRKKSLFSCNEMACSYSIYKIKSNIDCQKIGNQPDAKTNTLKWHFGPN